MIHLQTLNIPHKPLCVCQSMSCRYLTRKKFLKTILNQIDLKFLICQLQVATRKISFKHSRRIFYYEKIATAYNRNKEVLQHSDQHIKMQTRRKIIMDITLMTHIHIVTLTQLTNKVIIIMNGKVTGAHLKLNKVVNKTLATKQ